MQEPGTARKQDFQRMYQEVPLCVMVQPTMRTQYSSEHDHELESTHKAVLFLLFESVPP
jgi:hypothetical protein